MAFSSLPTNRQQRRKLWMAEGAAYLLAVILHAGLWHTYQTTPKPPSPEEPPPIEAALIVMPPPATVSQPLAAASPLPKIQPPPAVSKPVPKVEKAAPKKVEKPKPKPLPKPTPTPKPPPKSEPEPREESESAPVEPVREAPRESHHEAPPALHAAKEEGEEHSAVKAPRGPTEDTQYHPGGMSGLKRRYPHTALERGWEGTVTLKVHIHADGDIGEVMVVGSSGHDVLDEAAVDLIKEAHATPARRGDKTIDSWVVVPYRFTIQR